jgi:hypothetical protein
MVVGNALGDANALYHNNGDRTFTRITTNDIATIIGDTDGIAWCDFDNDGDLDLFVANWNVPSFLFRNDGSGNFSRVINGSMGSNATDTLGCSWGDYDNDGFPDLIVANQRQNPILYHNDGNETFTQILSGPVVTSGGATCLVWSDYDNDGALDLFTCRGAPGARSRLFHNDGGGNFNRVTTSTFIGDGKGGCDWGDYDNDGDLDLAVSGAPEPGGNDVLYRNAGGGEFTPIIAGGIFNGGDTSVMCAWGDYDNDGWLDLFMTHYPVAAPDVGKDNFLFHNNGDGTFTRITEGSIVNDGGKSVGCAWGDYDNDGFLDLFVSNGSDEARAVGFLYHNNGNNNRWLSIKCVGSASNRSGIGAKVRVQAVLGGITHRQLREISSGNGYNGSGLRAHFGLGDATNVDCVRIEWPSGTVQELRNVAVNQILTIKEPPMLKVVGTDASGAFQLSLKGFVGMVYSIAHSTNLIHWTTLPGFVTTNNITTITDATAISAPHRFYRAQEGE